MRMPDAFAGAPSARAALHMALADLYIKHNYLDNQFFKSSRSNHSTTLMTVGLGALEELPGKVADTRQAKAIKVKLGGIEDQLVLDAIKTLDNRMLFLDANQGLNTVEEALERIGRAGPERVIGMEQPFPKDRSDLHAALKKATDVPVYADESIQDLAELEAGHGAFDGVNVKLMKCGGLDRAEAMVRRARALGMKVMLGSMSESSLGCTAMARLAELAEVVDLDGPWLLRNDPFSGLAMGPAGELILPQGPGLGCELLAPLAWTPFGA
jgi:L-alanine-DL-glutamate epimerase-like enolase superfamily enzyme